MSTADNKPAGAELAEQPAEMSPDEAKVAALLHLLDDRFGMDKLLEARVWTGGRSSRDGHGSGFPRRIGDKDG
ncbi:hypothetical protein [Lentzea sp. CA-135723]|uniref:hypothetical protein n=1 Tax=Lentzea sp. CA-135723 TaxID=3239950 RepID=UPI003D8D823F